MPATASDVQIQLNWNNYAVLVTSVILYYDFLLTFRDEVEYFWKRSRNTLVAILFFMNRYLVLLGNIPTLVFRFWSHSSFSHTSCQAKEFYNQFFLAIIQLIISVLFVIRIFAIYERNKKLLAVMICAIIAMVMNGAIQWLRSKDTIGVDTTDSSTLGIDVGCLQSYTSSQGIHLAYMWLGIVIVDLLVFSLTIYRTIQMHRFLQGSNLVTVLMRDGALYFGIITLTNCANIVVFVVAKGFMTPLLSSFANVIASIMMTHLMLNLRAASQDMDLNQVTTVEIIPIRFAPHQISLPEMSFMES
ncbi:hypothetical protein K435DRAFT_834217 [Dendrothele bispora CBS 962.96]|uniref:DUF6533 domain-containing protein n=1 Tax=Dendrothele bispora (strain CBS 962.96) TaxID=1314807 RepID=A0A4S8MVU1_DENBC|nr:hypothetical protein K435DRAFT_834217 [Dendrothele bispora CBS 962.96]